MNVLKIERGEDGCAQDCYATIQLNANKLVSINNALSQMTKTEKYKRYRELLNSMRICSEMTSYGTATEWAMEPTWKRNLKKEGIL